MRKRLIIVLQTLVKLIRDIIFPPVVYTSCDEIKKWNFDKISETKDFKYLIAGSEFGRKTEAPEDAEIIWDEILEEYALKTKNNKALLYFEMLADISDMDNRAYFAEILLTELNNRYHSMRAEIRNEYLKELRAIRFYINESKPLRAEIERLIRQLKTVQTKLQAKIKEAEDFEEKNFGGEGISTSQIKIKIQKALKVNIDTKQTTLSEWLDWINEVTNGAK